MIETVDREFLTLRFSRYANLGKTFEKAVDAVLQGGVKAHIFIPSGRTVYTVVGNNGDEFIDPEKPFCSCGDFFFRVMGGSRDYCYHMLGYVIALEADRIDKTTFSDDEYSEFFRLVATDVLNRIERSRKIG